MLKDSWIDKQDGVDDVLAEDINSIANAVIDLEDNGGANIEIDDEMSDTSTNPVQNKVVKKYVDDNKFSVSTEHTFTEKQVFSAGASVLTEPTGGNDVVNKSFFDNHFFLLREAKNESEALVDITDTEISIIELFTGSGFSHLKIFAHLEFVEGTTAGKPFYCTANDDEYAIAYRSSVGSSSTEMTNIDFVCDWDWFSMSDEDVLGVSMSKFFVFPNSSLTNSNAFGSGKINVNKAQSIKIYVPNANITQNSYVRIYGY